jgi:hypothetical protein
VPVHAIVFSSYSPRNTLEKMISASDPRIPLPKSWNKYVRMAELHVISLAQYATVYILVITEMLGKATDLSWQ